MNQNHEAVRMSEAGDAADRQALEAEIQGLHARGDLRGATDLIVRGFGPEIFGWLMAVLRSEEQAAEIFSLFCENLWKSIGSFRWKSSARTWAYVIARHCHLRFVRDSFHKRAQPFRSGECSALEQQVRSTTLAYLKTEVKDELSRLREQLEPDDQSLLILRLDRGLSWSEIAAVLSETAEPVTADALKARAAALRKRFQRLKLELREALAPGTAD